MQRASSASVIARRDAVNVMHNTRPRLCMGWELSFTRGEINISARSGPSPSVMYIRKETRIQHNHISSRIGVSSNITNSQDVLAIMYTHDQHTT